MINSFGRIIILLALLGLALTLLPFLPGTGMIGFVEDNDIPEEDDLTFLSSIPIAWSRISIHRLFTFLKLGLSIFILLIVYRGGRSKSGIFNDRTIDVNNLFEGSLYFLKTALYRAVFKFHNALLKQGGFSLAINSRPIYVPKTGGS